MSSTRPRPATLAVAARARKPSSPPSSGRWWSGRRRHSRASSPAATSRSATRRVADAEPDEIGNELHRVGEGEGPVELQAVCRGDRRWCRVSPALVKASKPLGQLARDLSWAAFVCRPADGGTPRHSPCCPTRRASARQASRASPAPSSGLHGLPAVSTTASQDSRRPWGRRNSTSRWEALSITRTEGSFGNTGASSTVQALHVRRRPLLCSSCACRRHRTTARPAVPGHCARR